MIVTDKSDADWWEGYNEGEPSKVGFFPASFVEMLPAAAAFHLLISLIVVDYFVSLLLINQLYSLSLLHIHF